MEDGQRQEPHGPGLLTALSLVGLIHAIRRRSTNVQTMSKERLSRIDYLRDLLSQMGHPPANRIVWENELEELLKQSKPTKIRGSIKPRKCNHVAWNRKLLQGYKSDDSGWLPAGYFRSHADYVIPPYLKATWKAFLAGDPVYGKCWFRSLAPTAKSW